MDVGGVDANVGVEGRAVGGDLELVARRLGGRIDEAFADAVYHVIDKGARHSVRCSHMLVVALTFYFYYAVFDFNVDKGHDFHFKSALGALDGNMAAVDFYVDSLGQRYCFESYSRHLKRLRYHT